jgi:hypothetical protein
VKQGFRPNWRANIWVSPTPLYEPGIATVLGYYWSGHLHVHIALVQFDSDGAGKSEPVLGVAGVMPATGQVLLTGPNGASRDLSGKDP